MDPRNKNIEYLRARLRKMGAMYHARWPRWTYRDYCAVAFLLDYVSAQPAVAPDPPGRGEGDDREQVTAGG